ncbi:MAG TPA: [FeFe] hydrogenase H-cluster maturation GTPase HydF [Candidatus Acidoferrum sp.]|nr:[FeFe] hydrogenase H-cluster maturation GTPase HydF [Candidatus Acidoferrum sp.]
MATLNETPASERLNIAIFGRRNSGKSSLINSFAGHEVALVSETPGTTTDPVYKSMEIKGLGPCVLIDTAGFDDEGTLGALRVDKTAAVVARADVALVLVAADGAGDLSLEAEWIARLKEKGTPTLGILSKSDLAKEPDAQTKALEQKLGVPFMPLTTTGPFVTEPLRAALLRMLPEDFAGISLTGRLVKPGDTVLLVMPQDIQAPKGRLILPQVQTTRDLLDNGCVVVSVTADKLAAGLSALAAPPDLIITDSQVFPLVYEKKPAASRLTSFSVLMAAHKGDIAALAQGAQAVDALTENSRVLIAEACTHAPLEEDIGREKIPRMLRKRFGQGLSIDFVSGRDFPADLTGYDLVVHCGGCMFNRKYLLSRIEAAEATGVPMTNYGVLLAKLSGILDKVVY